MNVAYKLMPIDFGKAVVLSRKLTVFFFLWREMGLSEPKGYKQQSPKLFC